MTAATGAALAAVLLTGCSGHRASPRTSMSSCVQFGVDAISRHVTVTALPAACQGLSQAEVNQAVSRALRTVAAGAHGKVAQRELIASDNPYLAHLVRAVPPAGKPAAAPVWGQPSQAALGLAALVAWLITIGLGTAMMARWITRLLRHGARHGRERLPVRNLAHFALAIVSLLAWIGYLVTGIAGLAWTACGLLLPAAGLGMTLVFLGPARRSAPSAVSADASPVAAVPAGQAVLTRPGPTQAPPSSRRPAVLMIAAHISAAFLTILLGVLAAIGSG